MKKTKSKYRFIKQPLFIGLASLVLIGIGLAALELTHVTDFYHKKPATTTSPSKSQSNGSDPNSKIDLTPGTPADNADSNKAKADAGTPPNNTPSSGSAGGQVVATNTNISGDTIHVGTLVSGTTAGTCNALFVLNSNFSKTVSASSQVILQGNSYTCGALNASKSQFPQSGDYTVYVTLDSGGTQAKSSYNPPVTIP